jgi:hypothetical protein
MKFRLRFRPEFATDLEEGRCWYEGRTSGLGDKFVFEVSRSLAKIEKNPEWVQVDSDGIRSRRIERFPYVIHFVLSQDVIVVLAVMFGGRDPSAWRGRIEPDPPRS